MLSDPKPTDEVGGSSEPEVDLDEFIAGLLAKPKKGKTPQTLPPRRAAPPTHTVEVADALVLIATKVTCKTCGAEHISSSHVMRRIPRKDGAVYKPVIAPGVEWQLPRIVQWAWEEIDVCHWCFDMVPTVVVPHLTYYRGTPLPPALARLNGVHRCEYATMPPPWATQHKVGEVPCEECHHDPCRCPVERFRNEPAPHRIEVIEPEDLAYRSKGEAASLEDPPMDSEE